MDTPFRFAASSTLMNSVVLAPRTIWPIPLTIAISCFIMFYIMNGSVLSSIERYAHHGRAFPAFRPQHVCGTRLAGRRARRGGLLRRGLRDGRSQRRPDDGGRGRAG